MKNVGKKGLRKKVSSSGSIKITLTWCPKSDRGGEDRFIHRMALDNIVLREAPAVGRWRGLTPREFR